MESFWPKRWRHAERWCRGTSRQAGEHRAGHPQMGSEIAMRWGMQPFAVAQAISVISGKPMIEGKLVAAAVEKAAPL